MAGIYIHIPFCKRRCIYCDFFSTTQSEKKPTYIHALCQELQIRKGYLQDEEIETVYLGGGTPSQLSQDELESIFTTVYNIYKVREDAEITLEAFHQCREAGFRNISIDLMYGLPGETLDTWKEDLRQAIALHPEHISAYHLIYEEGTALWKLREEHQVEEADEDLSVSLFKTLIDELTQAGYQHYEISNFCLPGLHSRHNSSYWTGKKYLGCGPSAHSYDGMSRQWNVASLEAYIHGITHGNPDYEIEELDLYTRYNDFVITSIRTCWGMPLSRLRSEYGEELYRYCLRMAKPHLEQGVLEIKEDILKLTKEGIFISDGIMSDLLFV